MAQEPVNVDNNINKNLKQITQPSTTPSLTNEKISNSNLYHPPSSTSVAPTPQRFIYKVIKKDCDYNSTSSSESDDSNASEISDYPQHQFAYHQQHQQLHQQVPQPVYLAPPSLYVPGQSQQQQLQGPPLINQVCNSPPPMASFYDPYSQIYFFHSQPPCS